MTLAPACPYAGFDAAQHARECGVCDESELEERCSCPKDTMSQSMEDWSDGWIIKERQDEPARPFRDYAAERRGTQP